MLKFMSGQCRTLLDLCSPAFADYIRRHQIDEPRTPEDVILGPAQQHVLDFHLFLPHNDDYLNYP